MSIVLAGIHVYPVKGMRGLPLEAAEVRLRGLAGDRRWMVVDADGQFISQRSSPVLATAIAAPAGDGLLLTAPGRPDLEVRRPVGQATRQVRIWKDALAVAEAPEATAWLTALLGKAAHLVWLGDSHRPQSKPGSPPGAPLSFADGAPLLLIGEASLAELNGRLDVPVPMDRFRPNLVVRGALPFAEDGWADFRCGNARLRNVGPCARCTVTTVDQATGRRAGAEPLRTLATFRRRADGVDFGINVAVPGPGRIAVGDLLDLAGPRDDSAI